MLICSAINFLSNSTAKFFSFIFEISSKNLGSNKENSSLMSENRLITPSLLILCLRSSFILSFISGREIFLPLLPEQVKRTTKTRTASIKAASIRKFSSIKDEHKERACLRSKASLTKSSFCFSFSRAIIKFTAPLISFARSKFLPLAKPE